MTKKFKILVITYTSDIQQITRTAV